MAGFPLPLRNALAAVAIRALDEEAAREALEWLAAPTGPPTAAAAAVLAGVHLIDPGSAALLAVHALWATPAAAHARRALRAVDAIAGIPSGPPGPVAAAVRRATALWNEGLFFEVHEVLEAVWQAASGDTRQALQGVIQVAVAYHHLAHGNRRGARTLLREGRRRLAAAPHDALPTLDLDALLAATTPWDAALARGTVPPEPSPKLSPRR